MLPETGGPRQAGLACRLESPSLPLLPFHHPTCPSSRCRRLCTVFAGAHGAHAFFVAASAGRGRPCARDRTRAKRRLARADVRRPRREPKEASARPAHALMAPCTFSPSSAPQDNNRAKYSLCAFQLLLPTNQPTPNPNPRPNANANTNVNAESGHHPCATPEDAPQAPTFCTSRSAAPHVLPASLSPFPGRSPSREAAPVRPTTHPASRIQKPPPCRSRTPSHAPLDLPAGHLHTLPEPECRADKVRIPCASFRVVLLNTGSWVLAEVPGSARPPTHPLPLVLLSFYPSVISERPCSRGRKSGP